MSHSTFNTNPMHDPRHGAAGVAVLERDAKKGAKPQPKNSAASPHVVNLHGKLQIHQQPQRKEKQVTAPRGLGRLLHMLDDRIHLHDMRMRTLSIRPRGWKDFPPPGSKTLRHAVRITASRFFNEHPFAELTVLSLLHMTVLAIMHLAQLPGRIVHGKVSEAMTLPNHPVEEPVAPAVKSPSFKPAASASIKTAAEPKVRPLPLRARIAVWLSPTARKMRYKGEEASVLREVGVKILESEELGVRSPAVAPAEIESAAYTATAHFAWQRPLAGFAAIATMMILPFGVYGGINNAVELKDRVMELSVNSLNLLRSAGTSAQQRDFAGASRAFAQADEGFDKAVQELGALAAVLNAAPTILPGTKISAGASLLNAAQEIAQGGERLASGMAAADTQPDPGSKINALQAHLGDALPHLERATTELNRVSLAAVPSEYRDVIAEAQRSVPQLTSAVRKASAVTTVLNDVLGQTEPKRYLVIFQNNAELRPTGGFMGSFALMDISKGKVTKMEIPGGGTYDLKGTTQRINSPQPLHLINPLWQFQDSNWYADFPTSAKQITWFYNKAGGPTTDGVIAINATLMEELLKVTGPIEMPEYDKVITSENFYAETQRAVEIEYDKDENKPKQFIADLGPKVLDKLMSGGNDQLVKLAGIMDDALLRREVQLWMSDAETQARIQKLGWSGEMKNTTGDFLSVVHTNIAGQKSDRMMSDALEHAVQVLPDGAGIVTLTLTRTHNGVKGEQFSGVRNVDYVRFYVPQGATLVEARGFNAPDPKLFKLGKGDELEDPALAAEEKSSNVDRASGTRISVEGNKTVFGNWMMTDPGQSSTVTLVYQLPPGTIAVARAPEGRLASFYGKIVGNRRDRMDYSLLLQKQAGTNPMTVTSSIDLPRGFTLSWDSPQRTKDERGRYTVKAVLDRDAFLASVAEGL